MRLDVIKNFFSQLESLKSSTKRTIIRGNKMICLSGLNSPYASHKHVSVTVMPEYYHGIIVQNGRFTCIVSTKEEPCFKGFQPLPGLTRVETNAIIAELIKECPYPLEIEWEKEYQLFFRFSRGYVQTGEDSEYRTFELPNINLLVSDKENQKNIDEAYERNLVSLREKHAAI